MMDKSKYTGETSHGNVGRSAFTRDTSRWGQLAGERCSSSWDAESESKSKGRALRTGPLTSSHKVQTLLNIFYCKD